MADQTSGQSLPDPVSFDSPPVSQVILGIEFAGRVISEAAALADFWREIRAEFPEVAKQPRLSPMGETFDLQPPQAPFEFRLEGERAQRYIFRNEAKNLAIQVQEDRFAFSWDQASAAEAYPRYREIRKRFEEIYSIFLAAADEQGLAEHPPIWCATTYTNDIVHPDSDDPLHGPLEDILCFVCRPESDVLPPVEDTVFQQRRLLRTDNGEPRGRLHIRAIPALTAPPEFKPAYQLTLRVVTRPLESDKAGVLSCQDESRELIVRSFKDITTDKMHEMWGLQED